MVLATLAVVQTGDVQLEVAVEALAWQEVPALVHPQGQHQLQPFTVLLEGQETRGNLRWGKGNS